MIVFSMIMVPEELRRPLQRWLEEHMQHAAMAEREACALVADDRCKKATETKKDEERVDVRALRCGEQIAAIDIAAAIRSRPAP